MSVVRFWLIRLYSLLLLSHKIINRNRNIKDINFTFTYKEKMNLNNVPLEHTSILSWNSLNNAFITGCLVLAAFATIVSTQKKKLVPYVKANMLQCLLNSSGKTLGRTCYRLARPMGQPNSSIEKQLSFVVWFLQSFFTNGTY
jgi:hypothetical protein